MDEYIKAARGRYQRKIIRGEARISGADLRGKARKYSARYAESRRNLLSRLEAMCLPYHVEERERGRLVLVLGTW